MLNCSNQNRQTDEFQLTKHFNQQPEKLRRDKNPSLRFDYCGFAIETHTQQKRSETGQ